MSESLRLRLRGLTGSTSVGRYANTLTVTSFVEEAAATLGCNPRNLTFSTGFPPKTICVQGDTLITKILSSGDTVTFASKPPQTPACDDSTTSDFSEFQEGDQCIYLKTDAIVTIVKVHYDDVTPYYTVQFGDGTERQTPQDRLQKNQRSSQSQSSLHWACPVCTLENDTGDSCCSACGSRYPAQRRPGGLAQTPSTVSNWDCEVCTLSNLSTVAACEACSTARPPNGPLQSRCKRGVVANVQKIPDDNSCLFHGVAFLFDTSCSPSALRAHVARVVKANPIRWNEATLGKPIDEYCDFIADTRRWGGQVELAICSELYSAEIAVTTIQSGRVDIYGLGRGYSRRGYLLFTGIHFDAIAFDHHTTVPSDKYEAADEEVARVANDIRREGGFTDQASMRLKCTACGHIMNGDYEARLHAGTSGHKDFVQA